MVSVDRGRRFSAGDPRNGQSLAMENQDAGKKISRQKGQRFEGFTHDHVHGDEENGGSQSESLIAGLAVFNPRVVGIATALAYLSHSLGGGEPTATLATIGRIRWILVLTVGTDKGRWELVPTFLTEVRRFEVHRPTFLTLHSRSPLLSESTNGEDLQTSSGASLLDQGRGFPSLDSFSLRRDWRRNNLCSTNLLFFTFQVLLEL
jgi:hypothetical protein